MVSSIRRLLRRQFRRTGFARRIAPSFVDVMRRHAIELVFDVGANDGDFGREIRDEGYRGRIVSFEPNPAAFARLQQRIAADPLWEAYQLGVGDAAGRLALAVANSDVMSSFKGLTDLGQSSHARAVETVEVDVVRLDAFLTDHPDLRARSYLKIDTQGFEMEVLRGAGDMLCHFAAIQAELALVQTYADEEDWLTVLGWLRERGFEVATAVCNSAFPNEAQVREFDFVFVQRPRDRFASNGN